MFIVFDLDGTLIDGYRGIAHALEFAMKELDVTPLTLEQVRGMVGRGLEKLLEEAVGAELAPRGVLLFRERYAEIVDEETILLPDVPEVLDRLAEAGHVMAVASNKPARFSRRILAGKEVLSRFLAVAGPDGETPPKPDPTMIHDLRRQAGATAEDTVIVGDMEIDAETALAAGCRCVLVPGGSRSAEDLAAVPAAAHLARLADLPEAIARWSRGVRVPGPTIGA
jgi:phosphoglycolate phosphatase